MSILSTLITDATKPLENRNFRTYISGQAVSLIGTFMQQAAMQWFVWGITKDTRISTAVAALSFLPMLLLGPITGSVADRVDRRRLLLITISCEALLALALAGLAFAQITTIWPVMLIALGFGVATAFNFPAQSAFIGDLSGMGEIRSAFAFNVTMIEVGRVLGPSLAGVIVDRGGPGWAFLLNGLSFLAVLVSLTRIRAEHKRSTAPGSVLNGFREAVSYIRKTPRIIDLLLCSTCVTLFVFSSLSMVTPIVDLVINDGAELVGFMLGASGAGALIGSFIIAPQLQKIPRAGLALTLALIWAGFWLVLTSLFATPVPIIAGIFLFSVSIPIVLGSVTSLTQILTPNAMRARVLSVSQMISFGANPLGLLFIGWVAAALGPLLAVRVNGLIMLAAGVSILLLRRAFRDWRTERHGGAPAPRKV
jgi:MFS family permease